MDVDNDRPEQDIDMDAEGAIADDDALMVEDHHISEAEEHEGDEMYIEEEQHELEDEMEAEPTPPVEGHERGFSFSQPVPTSAAHTGSASPAIGVASPFTPGSLQALPLEPQGAGASGAGAGAEGTIVEDMSLGQGLIAPEVHADLSAIQEGQQEALSEEHAEDHEIENGDEQDEHEHFQDDHEQEHSQSQEESEQRIAENAEAQVEEYEEHEEEYQGDEEEYIDGEEGEEGYIHGEDGDEGQGEHDEEDESGAAEQATAQGGAEGATDAAGTPTGGVTAAADVTSHTGVPAGADAPEHTFDHPTATEDAADADNTIQQSIEEGYYDEDAGDDDDVDGDMDDYPHDIHSLPSIIINLPSLGSRALFNPLPDDESLPVWFSGSVEALGEASLANVWTAVKAELGKENLVRSGEMIITEKQMELKMGEDDVNLQSITLLELAQVHYGCGLPAPIQLYISFEPHRFITRFNAIQQEVQAQMKALAEEAVEVEVEFAGEIREGEGGEEEYYGGDEGDQEGGGEGEMWQQGPEGTGESSEVDTMAMRAVGDSQEERERRRDEYLRQKRERAENALAEHGSRADKHERVESDHPHADWAHSRLIEPPHTSGTRIIAPPRSPRPRADASANTQAEESTEAGASVALDVTVPPPAPAPREAAHNLNERRDDDGGSQAGGDQYAYEDKDTIDNTDTENDMTVTKEHVRIRRFPAEDSLDGQGLTPGQGDPHRAENDFDVDEAVDLSHDDTNGVEYDGDATDEVVPIDAPAETVAVASTERGLFDTTAPSPFSTPGVSVESSNPLETSSVVPSTTNRSGTDAVTGYVRSDIVTPDAKLAVVTEETIDDEGYVEGEDTSDEVDDDAAIDRADAVIRDAAEVVENAREASVGTGDDSALDSAQLAVKEAERDLEEAKRERDALETAEDDAAAYEDEDEDDDESDGIDAFADAAVEQVERGDEDADGDAIDPVSPADTLEGDSEIVPTASDEVVVTSSVHETPLSVTDVGEPTTAEANADDDEDNTSLDPSRETLTGPSYLSPRAKRSYGAFLAHEQNEEEDPERDDLLEQVDGYAEVEIATKKSRSE